MEDAKRLIRHYYIAEGKDRLNSALHDTPDILTFFSLRVDLLPAPTGEKYPKEGFDHINVMRFFNEGKAAIRRLNAAEDDVHFFAELAAVGAAFATEFGEMSSAHQMDSVFFGILHDDNGWNAYH